MPMLPATPRPTLLLASLLIALPAAAHDFRAGALVIDHPYALPSAAGAAAGHAHLRALRNTGDQPDRLLGAHTAIAASVALQRIQDGQPAQVVSAIDLPARSETLLRHSGDWALVLQQPNSVLKVGDRFTLTLRFERAGSKDVSVTVQQPRDKAGEHRR